jgi:hypothetical protein
MPASIRPVRVNHMNVVVEDYDESIAHFQKLYGADVLAALPSKEWRACLFDIGRVIFEMFAPFHFLLNARFGAHDVGVEYCADMDEVREALASHGVRVIRELKVAVHTHPADSLGVSFEFYGEQFHDRVGMPMDKQQNPASYWRDEHPLGLTGLKSYTIVAEALDPAVAFLKSFLSAEPLYDAARPAANGHAAVLKVADTEVEVIAPNGAGRIRSYLDRLAPGICANTFGVLDLEKARRYFEAKGIEVEASEKPDTFVIPASLNRGLVFEFSQWEGNGQ